MIEELHNIASRLVPHLLEGTAFLFADQLDCAPELPADAAWSGLALEFTCPEHGAVHMWVDSGFPELVAANMMGIEEDDPDAASKGLDALGEILNIIVGNCLTEVFGGSRAFHIAIPRPLPADSGEEDRQDDGLWFSVEGHIVYLGVRDIS